MRPYRGRPAARSLRQALTRSARACSSAAAEEMTVGNRHVGLRRSSDIRFDQTLLIGKQFERMRPRADAGLILSDMDICASRACYRLLYGDRPGGSVQWPSSVSVVTAAFHSFLFTQPVYEGDLVHHEGHLIHSGNSSAAVHMRVARQAWDTKAWSLVGESFITMVVVDRNRLGASVKDQLPALCLTDPQDIAAHHKYMALRKHSSEETDWPSPLTAEAVEVPHNAIKKLRIPMRVANLRADVFFPLTSNNYNGAVFGGALLSFMEKCALHCGRRFAGRSRVFTMGMLSMSFDGAVFREDAVSCTAQVACVRGSTILVDVRVDADCDGKRRSTNRASFLLVGTDAQGHTAPINKGIDLSVASEEELKVYWRGRRRMENALKMRNYPN
ncbi:ATP-binding protein Cassette (ABC) superfamily [Strigomonas culicis]|uniref:ATP-binding protein Cassette (ABC) superfamily n=1 Tax=Strigomonas culicis TaxID=28005 RepID=S9V2F2_9TRYP|nr:ATP-binding protein Cassette (ABC) superfamily [Strigomonas culicis]|eukprot:EPY35128.1 ATP-binding protein Cassette (ABC) superfamily [Strigomonas culicis]